MNVKIEASVIAGGQFGPELRLVVSNFPFIGQLAGETEHNLAVPLVAVPDRKLRDAVPPCQFCKQEKHPTMWVVADEQGDYTLRVSTAQPTKPEHADDPDQIKQEWLEVCSCDCLDCECCEASLNTILHESYLLHNPEDYATIDQAIATRLAQVGAIPGYTLDESGAIVPVLVAAPKRRDLTGLTFGS